MGGKAFCSGPNPLSTPRMPLAVYSAVKNHCQRVLELYFVHVDTPIEAPGKKDYGDVDFLAAVLTPLSNGSMSRGSSNAEALGKALGAKQSIWGKGSSTISFALPWPKEPQAKAVTDQTPPPEDDADRFVQVDVHVCDNKEEWDWELFHQAHGDLWNILGSTIRKHGFTVNNIGLFLRIEEIEEIDRKRSMVLLTKNPSDVLSFLGLDESSWWHQFESTQAMYEYAASCRYFWVGDEPKDAEEHKMALKHNDRQRMNQRPMFKKWIEEFIPQYRSSSAYSPPALTREQILDDAFKRFDVKVEYDQKLDDFRREKQTDEICRNIIKDLPTEDVDPQLRAASIRGLKAIVIKGDVSDGVIPPKPLKTASGFYDREAVIEFVASEWRHVGALELAKGRVRAAERMEEKRRGKGNEKNTVDLKDMVETHVFNIASR